MAQPQYHPHGVKQTNIEEIWGDLIKGMEHIFQHQGLSKEVYMKLYTYASDNQTRN